MPTRTDWLLRFIAGTERYDGAIDRLRIMKAIFLFQEEKQALAPREMNYKFRPYDYGPFTPEIYGDLQQLLAEGYIVEVTGGRSYRVTQQGREYLSGVTFPLKSLEALLELRVEVEDLGFRNLLKRVYTAHPESARRSVAKDVLD
ncbi:MAG: hypothetical protein Q7R32_06880 [Dehalococcoidia bacterium]|nr:hypothetical protein [Dehalococcoidia bacterium]